MRNNFWMLLLCALAWLGVTSVALASEYRGVVTFGGLPVPGAVVTASQGGKKVVALTDMRGMYAFGDLPDGKWTISIEMMAFETQKTDVVIAPGGPMAAFELKLMTLEQIRSSMKPVAGLITPTPQFKGVPAAGPETATDDMKEKAADGLLINGSVNNAATSKYTLAQAFGNNRNGGKSLYNGGVGFNLDNSALNAQPYSLSGTPVSKASYNRFTGLFTLGGPIKIPHLLRNGPNFFVGYQWTRDRDASTLPALVPTVAERAGIFASALIGYPTGMVPVNGVAAALLKLYPLPNLAGDARYNYQTPIVSNTHQDSLQSRLNKQIGRKDNVFGGFAFQSSRSSGPNLFAFIDTTDVLGWNANVNWSHRFSPRLGTTLGYQSSRVSTKLVPYWENRRNISGDAGISGDPTLGNNQDPMNWGPPSLSFSSGVYGLSDGQAAFNRNRTEGISPSIQWTHRGHTLSGGVDFRRQEYNYLAQQNPRGAFTFTGATTGNDVADFLVNAPATSALNTGNPDKYLRESVYDAYFTDDWRVSRQFTLQAGVRWEYGAPMTELKNRLVNLDIASGFTAVKQIVAGTPVGPLTGQAYPDSLVKPDKTHVQPRVGLSWRPIPGSSLVVRAGYGIYADTSVYQSSTLQLAQQSPFAKSFSEQRSATCLLTLTTFTPCTGTTANTFAVDPNFRVGYAQTWNVSAQKDLPGSLQGTLSYLGIKGTRGTQEFYPNSYAIGGVATGATVGFAYLTSNGNSTREQGQVQLRRRLHNGLTASLQYTYSKSIDNDSALGGQGPVAPGVTTTASTSNVSIAQDWRNLRAERSRSSFDQRHLLNATAQYTTGQGIGGHTLMSGWRGAAYKEWTVQSTLTYGSGLPETPVYPFALPGTGYTGNLRPSVTGASVTAAPAGYFLNPAAYTAPVAGQFGNAGRNSITGPNAFSLNASAARTFRLNTRFNLDARVDATNMLNHVTYSAWNTVYRSTQFGLATATSPMRSLQTTVRLRF